MDIFNFLGKKPNRNELIKLLVKFVLDGVKNERGVRVEDALCLASTIIAEKCVVAVGDYDFYDHNYTPGSRVFSEAVNVLLTGDDITKTWDELPAESVFGYLRQKVKTAFSLDIFPEIETIFSSFAARVGNETSANWGKVPYTIPEDNIPFLLPIRAGFESRPYIDKIFRKTDLDKHQKVMILVDVLADILGQTRQVIDPAIALKLSCETINGMAKTAPMTITLAEKAEKDKKNKS